MQILFIIMSYTYHAAVSVAACRNAKRPSYNNLHRAQTGLMIFFRVSSDVV